MTQQETLLALCQAKCLTCKGVKGTLTTCACGPFDEFLGRRLGLHRDPLGCPCPDCEGTGLLLQGLSEPCICGGSKWYTRDLAEPPCRCQGTGKVPPTVDVTDKLIAVLEAKGFTVRYNYNGSRRWGVTWALQWYGADTLPKAALLAVQAVEESQ